MENVGFNLLDFGVFRRIIHNTAGQMALQFAEAGIACNSSKARRDIQRFAVVRQT
jgi:hypothetical protein